MPTYFVRIGSLAEIHSADGPAGLDRDRRVIVRTSVGLQHGQVLSVGSDSPTPTDDLVATPTAERAQILRVATAEDELLIRRLNRHKSEAIRKCRAALAQSDSRAVLLDIDPLLDGTKLVMHFLGPIDTITASIVDDFAEQYESVAQIRHFAKLMRDGCGPDCGTEGAGCASGSCGSCSMAVACQPNAS